MKELSLQNLEAIHGGFFDPLTPPSVFAVLAAFAATLAAAVAELAELASHPNHLEV